MDRLWYVAYGSNTSLEYFASRFDAERDAEPVWNDESWVELPYALYFASSSQTWNGSAVAFVSLDRSEAARTVGRAFLIDRDSFDDVLAAEHLGIAHTWDFDVGELRVGAWCPVPTRAKYNAVLRLADVGGAPAFAITTARAFDRARPSDDYLSRCREGLASAPGLEDVDRYLGEAIERSLAGDASSVPPAPGAPFRWKRTLAELGSTGYPTVHLGPDDAWLAADGPLSGIVEADGRRAPAWFLPPQQGQDAGASPQVFRSLGIESVPPEGISCRLAVGYPVRLQRVPARSDDVEIADRVQVAPETARRLGPWALLASPTLSGPVSLSPRPHVPADCARVSYATRELWEFDSPSGHVSLLPLAAVQHRDRSGSGRFAKGVRRRISRVLEGLLGAPAVPLRATEGVVGDEGRAVIRVDSTALDFFGVRPGEEVVVSWADEETTARALLQTSELRDRMRDQLAQRTGRQSRLSTRARIETETLLWHLQAWLSPAVRDALVIPPDTVVRVRRNILHAIRRHLLALVVPVGGLTIAVLAIPGVPLALQIIVPLAALLLAFLPVRLPRA